MEREGLMAAGNYHWVDLNRTTAVIDYQRGLGYLSEWKVRLQLRMAHRLGRLFESSADADDRLTAFLLKYPVSANAVDAIYWLGAMPSARETPRVPAAYTRKRSIASPKLISATRRQRAWPSWVRVKKIPRSFLEKIPAASASFV